MPPPSEIGRTTFAIEYECGLDRAVTAVELEMNACQVASSLTTYVLAAWDDGSNWDDFSIGWDDWPPPGADL
jgi:hypothetical protein